METVNAQQKIHPHKFTLWIAIGSLLMMFAGLTSAFIVKSNQVNWKPVALPSIFWVSTVAIVLSSLTIYLANRAIKTQQIANYRIMLMATMVLGALFIFLQWKGFQELWAQQITFRGAGAGQFLYVIFGLHVLHVLGGIVALKIIWIRSFFNKHKFNSVPVDVASTYWHFVDLLWIYLLVFFLVIGGN
jgi:cytochrome c oxidase subunit 3